MMKNKTFFLSLATAAYTFLNTFPAVALDENDAILVKIQDIKPIKDKNGITTSCEFLSTIYNRTNMDLSEISFDLAWVDTAVKNTIAIEQNINPNGRNNLSGTADYISPDVISQISIPVLKRNSQKSMRGTINTDRCFILLEDAKIMVSYCKQNTKGKADKMQDIQSCQSLFKYISSKSPEYYTDFLAVSMETQKEMDIKEKQRQSEELDTLFKNAEANMNTTARLLNTTVAPVNPLPAAITLPEDKTSPASDSAANTDNMAKSDTPAKTADAPKTDTASGEASSKTTLKSEVEKTISPTQISVPNPSADKPQGE